MRLRALAALTLCAVLSACGGGIYGSNFVFSISAFVDGHSIARPVQSGQSISVSILPGESIAFDADEPVQWQFLLDGLLLFNSGSSVVVNGLAITRTSVSPSRVSLSSSVVGPAGAPVILTLLATSTLDAELVSTISIRIG